MNENAELKSYECCIIGAGPAGLGAALELVQHGINNILVVD
jgi:cation diffusion facilitator CzcD-associated flavoprotein CzcO